jgi:polyisoprenoid-binding protein YceI
MNAKAISLVAVLLLSATAHAESVAWNLDPAHSRIGFTARHLGFAKVSGQFKKFSAKVEADAKTGKLTKLEAEADAKSVDTGVEKRDAHLRSDDFFGADQYPTLKLELKSIKWKGKAFTATIAVTIRDVTKDTKFDGTVEGPQTVNFGQGPQQRVAYEAHAKIKRKDFGLKFNGLAEGIALVGDDVEMTLEGEMSMAQTVGMPPSAQTATPPTGKSMAATQPAAKPGSAMSPAAKAPASATPAAAATPKK